MHDDRLAHDAARLALELLAKIRPVNEPRSDQRREERNDHKSTDGKQNSRKHRAYIPIQFIGALRARASLDRQRLAP
ncbi:hypothetical protein D9M68_502230 [compost metagenome]